MTLHLDPRLWAAVLVELALLGYVLARRYRARTGEAPGGTSPAAWGLLCGLLPFVGLLLLIEATSRDEDAEPTPGVAIAPPRILAATVLPT
jgi:hypothetical protein